MRRNLAPLLQALCLASLIWLTIRIYSSPGAGIIPVRSTLNISAIAFLLFVASILGRKSSAHEFDPTPPPSRFIYIILALAAVAPFLPSLNTPFLSDDYAHLWHASEGASFTSALREAFAIHPIGGDGFFRPIGLLFYWIVFRVAGWSPAAWHVYAFVIHAANTLLLYTLLQRLLKSPWIPALGALIFAWHGAHVEAVCWTAAAFDLLATLFVLLTLIATSEAHTSRYASLLGCLAAILACLSKESAFCLPLLSVCVAFLQRDARRQAAFRRSLYLACACAAVFFYRIWFLQGIGGYRTSAGSPMVLHVNPMSTIQAFTLRLWTQLFLPINRSVPLEIWLKAALFSLLAGVALSVIFIKHLRPTSGANIGWSFRFILGTALPVFPILLIGWDLAGARVLYLPSIGYSLLLCVLLPRAPISVLLLSLFAVFQLTALLHNEFVWSEQARTASRACVTVATALRNNPSARAYAVNLPRSRKGVMFLGNGFPQCVALATGLTIDSHRISSTQNPPQPANDNDYVFTWDETAARLVRLK